MTMTHYVIALMLTAYGAAVIALTLCLFRRTKDDAERKNGIGNIDENNLPGVSIIIPFRNEAHNLSALLKSIGEQNYKGQMEVIFVDDDSDDNGADVIKSYLNTNNRIDIKIIDLHTSDISLDNMHQFKQLTTKQQALDIGAVKSAHHLIAFTDADIILLPNWVESLVNTWILTDADLIFGHTSVINDKKRRPTLESYQLEFLFAFACAFSKLNLTGSCMGNNLLVVKDAYLACGGQRGVGYSIVEDRALLELMRRRRHRTVAAKPFHTTALTHPCGSAAQFLNQMTRWAAGGLRPGGGLFIAGLLMLTQNGIFLLSAIDLAARMLFPIVFTHGAASGVPLPTAAAVGTTAAIPIAITALSAANFLMTWIFLTLSFKEHRSPAPTWFYPIHFLFMVIETIAFVWMLIFKPKISWKGRILTSP